MTSSLETVADLALIAPHLDVHLEWATQHRLRAGYAASTTASPTLAFWLIQSGTVAVRFSGSTEDVSENVVLRPSDAILMSTNRDRTITASHDATWLSAGFSLRLFSRDASVHLFPPVVQWHPEEPANARLCALLECARAQCRDRHLPHLPRTSPFLLCVPDGALQQWVADGIARALFAQAWESHYRRATLPGEPSPTPVTDPGMPSWIMNVLLHTANHPATATVQEMAGIARLSQSQFNRLFRRYVGYTPQQHLHRSRLQTARHLLLTTDHIIETIARSVGFESLSHFTRLFRKEYDVPPARFRQMQRHLRL